MINVSISFPIIFIATFYFIRIKRSRIFAFFKENLDVTSIADLAWIEYERSADIVLSS